MKPIHIPGWFLLLTLWGCGSHKGEVHWPELLAFDHAAERAEALLEQGGEVDPAELFQSVKASAEALLASPVPKGVAVPELVKIRLEDIRSLLEETEEAGTVTAGHLKAFHVIATSMLHSAGLPHAHGACEHCGQHH